MSTKLPRRDFLRIAPAGAGLLASAAQGPAPPRSPSQTKPQAAAVTISATPYTPLADYPIRPKRYSEVTVKDAFWKPKIALNAEVTIPFEVQKLTESGSGRALNGGVLEAAILSLQTHPDARLQAQVDARIQAMKQTPARGNNGFEIAVAYYTATGKRDLLDNAVKSADALYENVRVTQSSLLRRRERRNQLRATVSSDP